MSKSAPLIVELLARPSLDPGSLLIRPAAPWPADLGNDPRIVSLLGDLTRALPCWIHPDDPWSGEALEHMLSTGCQALPPGSRIHQSNLPDAPPPPPGIDWLRGDWYLSPPKAAGGSVAMSRSLALRLMQLVAADADTCDIEAIFRQDPVLAYHLLRLVNSLGMSTGRRVTSFSQAILILGRQQLKRWINLMLFAANRGDHRAPMLLARVSVRARSTELLARSAGLERSVQEQAFMAGLFSLLGTLFGNPLEDLLASLNLNDNTRDAVLHRKQSIGKMLNAVEAAEKQDAGTLVSELDALGISIEDFNCATLEAHLWMADVVHDTQEKRYG